jgi:amylosucrase
MSSVMPRISDGHRMIVLANFSDEPQIINGNTLRTSGMGRFFEDVITAASIPTSEPLTLEPYRVLWLQRA